MTVYDTSCHKQVSDCLKPNPALGIHSWKCIWIGLLRNSYHFVLGPHTFARDCLTQDSAACRVWTTMEQSRHYRTDSTLVGHYVDHSWYTPIELCMARFADSLASNRRQATSNQHAGVIMVILRVKGIISHPLNKQCSTEVDKSATRHYLCYWWVRPLTTLMRCVMFITCQWKLGKI